jgi:perosamine synthetase
MTGLQAALGMAQLERIEETLETKRRIAHRYNELLGDLPGLRLPVECEWARNVYWMYALVVDPASGLDRDRLATHLREEAIDTRTFFCGMHDQPFLTRQPGFRAVACPVADSLWERGLYLPSSHTLDDATQAIVAAAIRSAYARSPAAGGQAGTP